MTALEFEARMRKLPGGEYDVDVIHSNDSVPEFVGTVSKLTRHGLTQWRFKAGGLTPPALHGQFVSIGNTRQEAVQAGVEFVLSTKLGQRTDETRRLYFDLVETATKYRENSTQQDFRTGEAHRLLGRADYIMERLIRLGFARQPLVRVLHGGSEDWQVAA